MTNRDHSPSISQNDGGDAKPQPKPSEVLSRAADLIEPEGAWTQRELARDAQGRVCGPQDPAAICWCAAGAMQRQASYHSPAYCTAFSTLRQAICGRPIAAWNDAPRRSPADVVAALRKAADLAREAGQ